MRTRNRARYNSQYQPVTGGYTSEYNTYFEQMSDQNNGLLRPESPCDLVKCWTNPSEKGVLQNGGGRRFLHFPAYAQAAEFQSVAGQKMSEFMRIAKNHILQKEIGLSKRFSSINFFLELGDVGDLVKGLDRFRYIDYQFGIAPMVDDVKNIADRLGKSNKQINDRLDAASKPTPLKFNRTFHAGGIIQYPYANSQVAFNMDVRCNLNGAFTVELPLLSRFNRDYMLWLDQVGFHPDLATAWEATPFSWMIDWFVPVGKTLEGLSESWLNPAVIFNGSCSCTWNVTSTHTVMSSNYFDSQDYVVGEHVDTSVAKGYIRTPLGSYALGSQRPPIKLGGGLDSPGKITLLSDIFGPTKAPEKSSLTVDNFRQGYETLKKKIGR